MALVFTNFYKHVFALLSVDASILALVSDIENIRPSEDRSELKPNSAAIYYHFESSSFNSKQRRGEGIFVITASTSGTKVDATRLLETVREVLTARAISNASDKIKTPLFRERTAFTDSNPETISKRLEATTEFDVRLIEQT